MAEVRQARMSDPRLCSVDQPKARAGKKESDVGKDLDGKVALVTGAGRGIGRSIARALAAEGALVAVNYARSRAGAEALVREVEADGGAAFTLCADVSQVAAIERLYEDLDDELRRRTGDSRFDILVNNAGANLTFGIDAVGEAEFDATIAVNLKSVFFMSKLARSRLRDFGRIINISSVQTAGSVFIAYGFTKSAVNSLTVSFATELGSRGITVNSISPGMTDTDMIYHLKEPPGRVEDIIVNTVALRRMGTTDDIADAVLMLATERGRWITGQIIEASGGRVVI
jgi:3-oxoacyl-[acyl-carrier protein] reductase